MACQTCDHTMQLLPIVKDGKTMNREYWCPRCGTVKILHTHISAEYGVETDEEWLVPRNAAHATTESPASSP